MEDFETNLAWIIGEFCFSHLDCNISILGCYQKVLSASRYHDLNKKIFKGHYLSAQLAIFTDACVVKLWKLIAPKQTSGWIQRFFLELRAKLVILGLVPSSFS